MFFKRSLIFLLLCIVTSPLLAQKEANNWLFGGGAGLDFNYTPVQSVTYGKTNNSNVSACISDKNGKLLFYTDGSNIWGANNEVMENGTDIRCYTSNGAQSAIIIPKPGSENNYFLFTIDEVTTSESGTTGATDGLFCAEIDMSANNGNGAVIVKNRVRYFHNYVKSLTARLASNQKDYWLVLHASDSHNYLIFSVTENGEGTANVTGFTGGTRFMAGQMKFSPDGSRLAFADVSGRRVEVFDFQEVTSNGGRPGFSRVVTINGFLSATFGPGGLEFSPSGRFLYVTDGTGMYMCCNTAGDPFKESYLYQFDLSAFTDAEVNASKKIIHRNIAMSKMQLAPDGMIYIAGRKHVFNTDPGDFLSVIKAPDQPGDLCDFEYLGGNTKGRMVLDALPNFVQSFLLPCNYKIDLGADTTLCEGATLTYNLDGFGGNFVWNENVAGPAFTIGAAGTYTVKHEKETCVKLDTIVVQYRYKPAPAFDKDTLYLHQGSDIVIDLPGDGSLVRWQDGATIPAYIIRDTGLFTVTRTNDCGTTTNSLRVLPVVQLKVPNAFSPNGDGINDFFVVKGIADGQSWSLSVFNRWGGEVYRNRQYNNTFNGKGLDTGIYVYLLKNNRTGEVIKGTVALLR